MAKTTAPIAVFAYNRPDHLRRTLISLRACEGFAEAPITVFIDGPRSPGEAKVVDAVQQVAREILGTKSDIRASEANRGLSASITAGVQDRLDCHGRVIVIEDDLDLGRNFLTFMNAALDRYADDPRVFQVSGYMFDVPSFASRSDAMFLPLTTTWGWGTWSRAWKAYDPAAAGWRRLLSDRALRRRFNMDGSYDYTRLMKRQARGQSDSWGIRWYWSVFQHDGLCLFPPQSLVHNTGQDGSGTHGGALLGDFSARAVPLFGTLPTLPNKTAVARDDLASARAAIWRQRGGWPGWFLSKAQDWMGR